MELRRGCLLLLYNLYGSASAIQVFASFVRVFSVCCDVIQNWMDMKIGKCPEIQHI